MGGPGFEGGQDRGVSLPPNAAEFQGLEAPAEEGEDRGLSNKNAEISTLRQALLGEAAGGDHFENYRRAR